MNGLAASLRQMLAVLEEERQALAALDLGAITASCETKQEICGTLVAANDGAAAPGGPDAECRALLEAARHANETNRRIRNLLAANVAARLEALSGKPATYRAPAARIA